MAIKSNHLSIKKLISPLYSKDLIGLPPLWPPDVFAICFYILMQSGRYTHVINRWPPKSYGTVSEWECTVELLGKDWASKINDDEAANHSCLPDRVKKLWSLVFKKKNINLPINDFLTDEVCHAIIEIGIIADIACNGAGHDAPDRWISRRFSILLWSIENGKSSLCIEVNSDIVCVLPKMRVPQTGLTVRSLSHYVCLCPSHDISPKWMEWCRDERKGINMLFIPWPFIASRESFEPVNDLQKVALPDFPWVLS
jgi:hypothetical protein